MKLKSDVDLTEDNEIEQYYEEYTCTTDIISVSLFI